MRKIGQNTSDYTGIITVFALILVIEYDKSIYDKWDIVISLMAFLVGIFFAAKIKSKDDLVYTLLTSALNALCLVTLFCAVYFINNHSKPPEKYEYECIETQKWKWFLGLTALHFISPIAWNWWNRKSM